MSTLAVPPAVAPVSAETSWPVQGMTCASCAGRVEKAVQAVPGVLGADVNLANEVATVTVSTQTATDALVAAVQRAGYEVQAPQGEAADRGPLLGEGARVVLAALLSAPLVLPMIALLWGAHWMPPAQ